MSYNSRNSFRRRNNIYSYNNNSNLNSRFARNESTSLNYNQRLLLDTYLGMYNSTLRQIDALYDNLNEIKHNIDFIVGIGSEESDNENYEFNNQNTRNNVTNNIDNDHSQDAIVGRMSGNINNINLPHQELNQSSPNNLNDTINLLLNYISPNSFIPTTEEISQATRIIRYSEIENPINDRCPISHEVFEEDDIVSQIVFCKHIFKSEQINTWFQRNSHCPVCRHNIITTNFFNTSVINNSNTISSNPSSGSNPENGIATGGNATSSNNILNNIPSINEIITSYGNDISNNYLLFETVYRRI